MQQAELPQPTIAEAPDSIGADWLDAMARGDFAAAWQASDRALALRVPSERDDPALPYHQRWVWDGSPVDGRSVLVRCYHGLGDTLQFCRYLPALRTRAAYVTLEVQPELAPLMALVGGADRIVPFDPAAPSPPAACDLEIMELAHALRIPPAPEPYLPIARGPASATIRVGVCWKVNSTWRPQRSMRDADAAALAALPGIRLQSLQGGASLPGMAHCPAAVVDTARLVAGLDLVVTVDTMVAHLAGAIGTPVWLLLEAAPDWRWLAGGRADSRASSRGSPWYRNVRKYWQHAADNWEQPMSQVVDDLTRLVQTGTVEV